MTLATELSAINAYAMDEAALRRITERVAALEETFARAQRTLLATSEILRQLRRGDISSINDHVVETTIDACSLAAMQPGVVEYSTTAEPIASAVGAQTGTWKIDELIDLAVTTRDSTRFPWKVGAGRLSVELHALTDLLALARSLGAEVGTFTVHELARIAGDLHASSYVEHSIALNQIHAILNNMPDTTLPMPGGADYAMKSTVERVRILVDVLRKATDALGGAS